MVCAWPEPPCARPAEPSAGVRSERLASADVFELPAGGGLSACKAARADDLRRPGAMTVDAAVKGCCEVAKSQTPVLGGAVPCAMGMFS
jgi:hypothetical protein